ncbi:MAG: queuosine precursor transporter [Gammaproteobacteria bacterium]
MEILLFTIKAYLKIFWIRLNESVFVTKNQYKLRLLHCYEAKNNKIIAIIQVVIKRVKGKFSIRYLAYNSRILREIHPVNACKLAFIANIEGEVPLDQIPPDMQILPLSCPIIKQSPTLKISAQNFSNKDKQTVFTLTDLHSNYVNTLTASELAINHPLLYALGSHEAARVGISASNDYLSNVVESVTTNNEITAAASSPFQYFHILCISYITLVLAGLSIVRRMFPYHIPFTDFVVTFGGGILFFPLVFCIQDITTEVYGFAAARQMVILSIFSILFYVCYSQLVIHLPSGIGPVFQDNEAFSTVFNTQPRQVIALIVSLFIGSLINDFLISQSKVILAGQYLWARLLGSTMIGEAVLQVVGGVIGFSDKLDFKTQLLPNMILAYGYKVLWCVATIPLIYMISSFLKKKEGIDVYDYDANYNPFSLSGTPKRSNI